MHRRVVIKKTWLSAFTYAQSRISLDFCRSLGFLVPWFSPLQLNKIWRIFCVMYGEEGGGESLFTFYFSTFKMVLKLNFRLFSYLYCLKMMRQRRHPLAG